MSSYDCAGCGNPLGVFCADCGYNDNDVSAKDAQRAALRRRTYTCESGANYLFGPRWAMCATRVVTLELGERAASALMSDG